MFSNIKITPENKKLIEASNEHVKLRKDEINNEIEKLENEWKKLDVDHNLLCEKLNFDESKYRTLKENSISTKPNNRYSSTSDMEEVKTPNGIKFGEDFIKYLTKSDILTQKYKLNETDKLIIRLKEFMQTYLKMQKKDIKDDIKDDIPIYYYIDNESHGKKIKRYEPYYSKNNEEIKDIYKAFNLFEYTLSLNNLPTEQSEEYITYKTYSNYLGIYYKNYLVLEIRFLIFERFSEYHRYNKSHRGAYSNYYDDRPQDILSYSKVIFQYRI